MPQTDYSDPEIPYPRLRIRIQKRESEAYWLTIWLHDKPDVDGHRIVNGKFFGSFPDAHERVTQTAKEFKADVGSDDFTIDWPEMERD
ncbi:hypothetical protein [Tardiphaga sp. 619_E2_N8_5]|uniref:hypothetical protein n=1 Tax=unclassified Tardiphaga TaxID=2631404 RepID=UPI003F22AAE0